MAVLINIGAQTINYMSNSAGVFSGENVQQGWSTINKNNVAVFTPGQLNSFINNINIVYDPDFIDNPVASPNINVPAAPAIIRGI